jgi:hypothetical protein
MRECIICGSDCDVSRYPGFCPACADRAVWGIDHLGFSRIKIPERLEGYDAWGAPERLELAERAIADAVGRLGALHKEDEHDLLAPASPSDSPVLLILLAVATSAEVMRLRARVGELEAEALHHHASPARGVDDLAEIAGGYPQEKKQ